MKYFLLGFKIYDIIDLFTLSNKFRKFLFLVQKFNFCRVSAKQVFYSFELKTEPEWTTLLMSQIVNAREFISLICCRLPLNLFINVHFSLMTICISQTEDSFIIYKFKFSVSVWIVELSCWPLSYWRYKISVLFEWTSCNPKKKITLAARLNFKPHSSLHRSLGRVYQSSRVEFRLQAGEAGQFYFSCSFVGTIYWLLSSP